LPLLADAVRAVGRLGLDRRVPPGVEVDHGVRGGEVQSHAAGLEADQEDRGLALLEAADDLLAVARVAGEQLVGDAGALELRLDQREHAGELREQQHAAALVDQLGQDVHQQPRASPAP